MQLADYHVPPFKPLPFLRVKTSQATEINFISPPSTTFHLLNEILLLIKITASCDYSSSDTRTSFNELTVLLAGFAARELFQGPCILEQSRKSCMLDWRPYWSNRTLPVVTMFQHCSPTTWAKPSISTFSILSKLLQPNLLTESFIGSVVKVTYCFSAFQLIYVAVMTKFLCVDPPLKAAINPFTRKVPTSIPQK